MFPVSTHHGNLEAGDNTAAALLGVFGPIRQLLHHAHYLHRGPGVSTLLEAERQVTEMARGVGGHQTEDLLSELLR